LSGIFVTGLLKGAYIDKKLTSIGVGTGSEYFGFAPWSICCAFFFVDAYVKVSWAAWRHDRKNILIFGAFEAMGDFHN